MKHGDSLDHTAQADPLFSCRFCDHDALAGNGRRWA